MFFISESFYCPLFLWSKVSDSGGIDSDPDPTLEKNLDPDPTIKKQPGCEVIELFHALLFLSIQKLIYIIEIS